MTELDKFLKKEFGLNKKEFITKYSNIVIKKGSLIIKKTKECEVLGIRNSRDKKWFLDIKFDFNSSASSCNYQSIRIAKGAY